MDMDPRKHLFDARAFVIPGEDPAEYEALASELYRQFAPDDRVESFHVDMLIHDVWNRRRLLRLQAQFPYDPAKPRMNAMLDYASQRLPQIERNYARTLKELLAMQRRRQPKRANPRKRGELASISPQPAAPRPRRIPAKTTAKGEWVN
jgi:hypothetical protein